MIVIVDGEEVPGVIAYGLHGSSKRGARGLPPLPWSTPHAIDEFVMHGEKWEIVGWEIALDGWPTGSEWRAAIRATLAAHLAAGSRVAWIGAEGLPFCDPPRLFDPACMTGGVLAWMTAQDFECLLDPDEPLAPVADSTLSQLRNYAEGLADAR